MNRSTFLLTFLSFLVGISYVKSATKRWNQTATYKVEVDFKGWSNFYPLNGGCVSCPYTCVLPSYGIDGVALNRSNQTAMQSLPAVFNQPVMNGCCYAPKSKSKVMPDCNNKANPVEAEDCGFTYGPTLQWGIDKKGMPGTKKSLRAVLFASTDCENFWAVQQTYVKREGKKDSRIEGSKQMNGGCYGAATGTAIILAGCLTESLKYDRSASYSWDMLAAKCNGLSGRCTRTNAIWGKTLPCCTNRDDITNSNWSTTTYPLYNQSPDSGVQLSGPAVCGIVFGGVALLMALVHFGAKVRERAKQTALMREQEATDDYEEIMTPLTGGDKRPAPLQRPIGPASVEVSLHEGDKIFKKDEPELLYEGDLM